MKKIWIEGIETAGLVHTLAQGFSKQGYKVITFADKNPFYNYTYSIDKYNFINDLKSTKLLNYPVLTRLGLIYINKFAPHKRTQFFKRIQLKLLTRVDFYIPIFETHFLKEIDFKEIVKHKTKIIGYFLGSEIRIYSVFCKHFNVSQEVLGQTYLNESFQNKASKLRYFEKYAHCIFSVPDQMSIATKAYFHLQLPFDTSKFVFRINENETPIVLHCPSNSDFKGTSIIKQVIAELKNEGLNFEFKLLQNIPHTELLKELTKADILVDELYGNGPGLLSFEAMASGCAVLTKHLEDSPDCFKPPVIAVNKDSLKEKLKAILLAKDKQVEFAKNGKTYLMQHNNLDKVITDMLQKMEATEAQLKTNGYDYYPNFEDVSSAYLSNEQKQLLKDLVLN